MNSRVFSKIGLFGINALPSYRLPVLGCLLENWFMKSPTFLRQGFFLFRGSAVHSCLTFLISHTLKQAKKPRIFMQGFVMLRKLFIFGAYYYFSMIEALTFQRRGFFIYSRSRIPARPQNVDDA